MSRPLLLLALSAALVGCNNERTAYQQPAADSYRTMTVRVNIDNTVSTVQAAQVSPDFFEQTGVHPLVGRFFVKGDSGATPVVVLSYSLWLDQMGASPSVIGSKIDVDSVPTVVIGIVPRDFQIPDGVLLWTLK